MDESERLQRWKENYGWEESGTYSATQDENVSSRIISLLNHPQIDKYCMVDAYYYDFSVIPKGVQERFQIWRDAYLIYGITTEGEMVTRWVDRWDLDSLDPIVNGKVIHSDKPLRNSFIPEINQSFNPHLLSTPIATIESHTIPPKKK